MLLDLLINIYKADSRFQSILEINNEHLEKEEDSRRVFPL